MAVLRVRLLLGPDDAPKTELLSRSPARASSPARPAQGLERGPSLRRADLGKLLPARLSTACGGQFSESLARLCMRALLHSGTICRLIGCSTCHHPLVCRGLLRSVAATAGGSDGDPAALTLAALRGQAATQAEQVATILQVNRPLVQEEYDVVGLVHVHAAPHSAGPYAGHG